MHPPAINLAARHQPTTCQTAPHIRCGLRFKGAEKQPPTHTQPQGQGLSHSALPPRGAASVMVLSLFPRTASTQKTWTSHKPNSHTIPCSSPEPSPPARFHLLPPMPWGHDGPHNQTLLDHTLHTTTALPLGASLHHHLSCISSPAKRKPPPNPMSPGGSGCNNLTIKPLTSLHLITVCS